MELNTLLLTKQYGGITIRLKEQMDKRGISRYKLARSINTRFEVVNKWYCGEVEKLDLDVLARICYILDCRIEDILVYSPPKTEN